MTTLPNFRDPAVLLDHAQHTMRFYHPRAIDPAGGMYQYFKDDGAIYDPRHRHLVSSTRFVFTYAMAYRHFQDPAYLEGVRHAVRFLREAHRAPDGSGYAWMLVMMKGAQPIIVDGQVIGAIGVSADTPAHDDEIALAALAILSRQATQ